MHRLAGNRVLLCVGGGIAAYKAAEVVRRLLAAGADVQVAMTQAAREFITPLTLQALSRRPVATSLLDPGEDATIGHIKIAQDADAVLVAPATADLIARMAAGMADDIVTAALLVTRAPVVVAPAMNTHMLSHPATARNIAALASFGHRIVDSDHGELACGYEGLGRLPDPEVLLAELSAALSPQDLTGVRVLVSAGPTREPLDPVRYLTNRSSGRMGYAVAAAAWRRGARVTLVSGPTSLAAPRGVERIDVGTAAEMKKALEAHADASDVIVMVAAVADYRPSRVAEAKIKKKAGEPMVLELAENEDILAALARRSSDAIVVGFAAETNDVVRHGRDKLVRKGVDLIVANDVTRAGAGFETETNAAVLLDAAGEDEETGLVTKDELADRILDRVVALRARPRARRAVTSA
ncbi:MAG TPA: bifunctional phosphopantothenoylcysteine decarboxylase/phosphopantothenate--cysteine ligase CoaBC [Candidatus Limnocylindrales bacterium]|nr:bifunctional phosphopantothenoylcysteine decarboxylase/phosphopantothenate--cysteine ligase CoaBC [Candidatus Limnocylindrales bacterium]